MLFEGPQSGDLQHIRRISSQTDGFGIPSNYLSLRKGIRGKKEYESC